jgi:uncharacterized protein
MSASPSSSTTLPQLPLFPLQSVLFPGGVLPLQIFEVRYLDMIGRRHQAGEPFGVVCLTRGGEVRQRVDTPNGPAFADEAFHPIGTLARIDEIERPRPGLMMVRCTGTRRFRLRDGAQQKFGLWTADVELLDDDAPMPVPEDIAFARDGLQSLMRQIERATGPNGEGAELALPEPHRWDECGWIANRWCELLPLDPAVKQRFMALESPVLRLELVADALGQMGFEIGE